MLKGKYTVELFDKNTEKIIDTIESKNIVFSNTLQKFAFDHNFLQVFNSSLHSQTGSNFCNLFKPEVRYSAHCGSPINMILAKKNESATNNILNFNESIIGYAPRWNTNTANYTATQGFLESATVLHDRARYVFRFPDITANGEFNSIIMGPNIINTQSMKLKNRYENIHISPNKYSNNVTFVNGKVYETDAGKMNVYTIEEFITKKAPSISKPCSVMTKLSTMSGYSTNDRKHVIIPFGDKYLFASHNTNKLYLLDSDCNILSEIVISPTTTGTFMSVKCSHAVYDTANSFFFLSKTKKLTITNNVLAIADLSDPDKLSPIYKIMTKLSTANGDYYQGDNFAYTNNSVFNFNTGKTYSLSTGDEISSAVFIENQYVATSFRGNGPDSPFYYDININTNTQPYSYTLLENPVIKTNDKFMKITYETQITSDVFSELKTLLGNFSPASTFSLNNEEEYNTLDINPPINLHPDEPYGGLI